MPPTPYSELNSVLDRLVAGMRDVLGDMLVGAYLQGSFAAGDFDVHSDVDFIAVTEGELTDPLLEGLQSIHGRVFDLDCEWAQHLEGSYFPREVLRTCDRRDEKLWYLEHGDRALVLSEHCNTAVVRWVVREQGVALAGPPAASLVDAVPADTLRNEVLATMRDWGGEILEEPERFNNRFYQSFIVLTYCRMLYGLRTGRVESKRAGADWAMTALDPSWSDLIDRAWDARPDPSTSIRQPADAEDFRRTLEFVRYSIEMGPGVEEAPGAERDKRP